jgi:hypothetical protein
MRLIGTAVYRALAPNRFKLFLSSEGSASLTTRSGGSSAALIRYLHSLLEVSLNQTRLASGL